MHHHPLIIIIKSKLSDFDPLPTHHNHEHSQPRGDEVFHPLVPEPQTTKNKPKKERISFAAREIDAGVSLLLLCWSTDLCIPKIVLLFEFTHTPLEVSHEEDTDRDPVRHDQSRVDTPGHPSPEQGFQETTRAIIDIRTALPLQETIPEMSEASSFLETLFHKLGILEIPEVCARQGEQMVEERAK